MSGTNSLLIECDKTIGFYTKQLDILRKSIELQEKAIKLFKELDPKIDISDFKEIEKLNNFAGYLTISTLDLSVNLKNLILSKTDWEKIFFIKNSYLIVHETLVKLKPYKGQSPIEYPIRKNYPSLHTRFSDLMAEIDEYRNRPYYKKIENTRHFTAGHIEKSLKKYYDTIIDLDGETAGQNIREFLKITTKALNLSKDITFLANKILEKKSIESDRKLKELMAKLTKITEK